MFINLKRYVNSVIFKIKERPFYVDSNFWNDLKIIDIEEVKFDV